jgi:hypothetical protein
MADDSSEAMNRRHVLRLGGLEPMVVHAHARPGLRNAYELAMQVRKGLEQTSVKLG